MGVGCRSRTIRPGGRVGRGSSRPSCFDRIYEAAAASEKSDANGDGEDARQRQDLVSATGHVAAVPDQKARPACTRMAPTCTESMMRPSGGAHPRRRWRQPGRLSQQAVRGGRLQVGLHVRARRHPLDEPVVHVHLHSGRHAASGGAPAGDGPARSGRAANPEKRTPIDTLLSISRKQVVPPRLRRRVVVRASRRPFARTTGNSRDTAAPRGAPRKRPRAPGRSAGRSCWPSATSRASTLRRARADTAASRPAESFRTSSAVLRIHLGRRGRRAGLRPRRAAPRPPRRVARAVPPGPGGQSGEQGEPTGGRPREPGRGRHGGRLLCRLIRCGRPAVDSRVGSSDTGAPDASTRPGLR